MVYHVYTVLYLLLPSCWVFLMSVFTHMSSCKAVSVRFVYNGLLRDLFQELLSQLNRNGSLRAVQSSV